MAQHVVGDRLDIVRINIITAGQPGMRACTAIDGDGCSRAGAVQRPLSQVVTVGAGIARRNDDVDDVLLEFGREVVRESNRLGIIIDMAHANHETMMDILELSEHPVIFSHGGVREYTDHDRAVTDDEIRAIAAQGGVIGIWPHGRHISDVAEMVDYIEHVIKVGGVDHVGIGSDLRGISRYVAGFDEEARFHAIGSELLNREYSAEDVGKVMGGNFFRVWQAVTGEYVEP